jgi:hypothetical protein
MTAVSFQMYRNPTTKSGGGDFSMGSVTVGSNAPAGCITAWFQTKLTDKLLKFGVRVSYELEPGCDTPRAANVQVVG